MTWPIISSWRTSFSRAACGAGFDPDEIQSQDIRGHFKQDQEGMADTFTPCQEFPDDYDQEEVDIKGEPLFADELTQQASAQKKRRQSIRTKAYTKDEDMLICKA